MSVLALNPPSPKSNEALNFPFPNPTQSKAHELTPPLTTVPIICPYLSQRVPKLTAPIICQVNELRSKTDFGADVRPATQGTEGESKRGKAALENN